MKPADRPHTREALNPVDASIGPGTDAFWRMRGRAGTSRPLPVGSARSRPHDAPSGAIADRHRAVMRQPGRAAGGRRLG